MDKWYEMTPTQLQDDALGRLRLYAAPPPSYTMLEAPTGVGKSLIAIRWLDNQPDGGVILTQTLSLLNQYEAVGIPVVRGASNFKCGRSKGSKCSDHRRKCDDCSYAHQRNVGYSSPIFATTYAHFFAARLWQSIDNVVCDEGQRLDDILTQHATMPLAKSFVSRPPEPPYDVWADEQIIYAAEQRWRFSHWGRVHVWRLRRLRDTTGPLVRLNDETDNENYYLAPLWPTTEFSRLFGEHRVIVQSATLLGDYVSRYVLVPSELHPVVNYIAIDSPFSVNRRPIIVDPVAYLSRLSSLDDWRAVANRIYEIRRGVGKGDLGLNNDYRGLVHVASRRQVEMLRAMIPYDDSHLWLFHTNERGKSRTDLFNAFRHMVGSPWLVSSSADEGEDFPYEGCRINIIAKIKYPDLGSPLVAARRESGTIGKEWFEAKSVASVVQAAGRAMRREDDWGLTYVLDSNVKRLLRKDYLWPRWAKEAVVSR